MRRSGSNKSATNGAGYFFSFSPWSGRETLPRTLPVTPRNKNLSKVFAPLYDGMKNPRRKSPGSPAAPATFINQQK